jgi:hypothetical protein
MNPRRLWKLKQLSFVSLCSTKKVCRRCCVRCCGSVTRRPCRCLAQVVSYDEVKAAFDLADAAEVERLVTESVYGGLVEVWVAVWLSRRTLPHVFRRPRAPRVLRPMLGTTRVLRVRLARVVPGQAGPATARVSLALRHRPRHLTRATRRDDLRHGQVVRDATTALELPVRCCIVVAARCTIMRCVCVYVCVCVCVFLAGSPLPATSCRS